jgi:hypothetical protein
VFNLVNAAAWADNAATTGATCGSACTDPATCVMYKFIVNEAGDGSGKCSLLLEETTNPSYKIGFKIGNGDDYSVWGLTQAVGLALLNQPADIANESACLAACTAVAECELYAWQVTGGGGSACTLAASQLEESTISMFQVRGDHLASDLHP